MAANVPWWITATSGEDYDGNPTVTYKTIDGTRVFPEAGGAWRKGVGPGNNQSSYTDDGGDTHQGDVVSAPSTVDATGRSGFIPAGSAALSNSGGAFLNLTGGNTPTVLDTAASGAAGGASIGSMLQAATQGATPGYLPPSDAFTQVQKPVQSNAGFEFGPLSVMALPFAAAALGGGFGAGALGGAEAAGGIGSGLGMASGEVLAGQGAGLGIGGVASGLGGLAGDGLISAETASGPAAQFGGYSAGVNPAAGLVEDFATPELLKAGQGVLSGLPTAAAGGAAGGALGSLITPSTVAGAGLSAATAGLGGGGGQTQAEMDAANAGQQAGQDAQGELGSTSTTPGTANDPSQYPINPATGLPFTPGETPTTPGGTGTGNKNLDAFSRILDGTAGTSDYLSAFGALGPSILGAIGSNQQAKAYGDIAAQQKAQHDQAVSFGAPYRDQLANLRANPNGFLSSPQVQVPVQQGTDAVARALSTGGNPAGSGRALQELQNYSSNQLFGKLGQEEDRLAGYGGLTAYSNAGAAPIPTSGATAAIGADSNVYNSLGYGINSALGQPASSLTDVLKSLKLGGLA